MSEVSLKSKLWCVEEVSKQQKQEFSTKITHLMVEYGVYKLQAEIVDVED